MRVDDKLKELLLKAPRALFVLFSVISWIVSSPQKRTIHKVTRRKHERNLYLFRAFFSLCSSYVRARHDLSCVVNKLKRQTEVYRTSDPTRARLIGLVAES